MLDRGAGFQKASSVLRMLDDELADSFDGLLTLGQEACEELPDVDHLGPNLKCYFNSGGACPMRGAGRVVEQDLVVADLDEQRRQPLKIRIKRRGERVRALLPAR